MLPPLSVVTDLESLGGGLGQEARQTVLARLTRAIGAADLWTFVVVEDDLFLRDCVGAVPGADELAAVTEAQETDRRWSGRGPRAARRVMVYPPSDSSSLLLGVAFDRDEESPSPWADHILDCLATALAAEEGATAERDPAADRLSSELARLAERLIGHALSMADGDRDRAAALLGALRSELDALDPSGGPL